MTFWKSLKLKFSSPEVWDERNSIWESPAHLYPSPWAQVYEAATLIGPISEMRKLWEGKIALQISQCQVSVGAGWSDCGAHALDHSGGLPPARQRGRQSGAHNVRLFFQNLRFLSPHPFQP